MTNNNRCKVVIAGGGTGGHLYPAIAIAEEIKKKMPQADILFMGTDRGIETRVLPLEKYYVKLLRTEGFVGVSLGKKIWAFFKLIVAFFDAVSFLRGVRPSVVIGTGGYASFVPVAAAALLSIPIVIHEQNSIPGLANKLLSKVADKVCITYESSLDYLPKDKAIITGNPVREKILRATRAQGLEMFSLRDDLLTVLIFGGSAGATAINKAVMGTLPLLNNYKDKIQFLHQTGNADYELVRGAYQHNGFSGTVAPFIFNMPEAYACCDMLISRAGATTLAEITTIGIPAILIPYPYAAGAHQEANAARLSSSTAAIMIRQQELDSESLARQIIALCSDANLRNRLKRDCKALGKPDAGKRVAHIALMLMKDKSHYYKQEYDRCLTSTE
ncbi:undecaprenyldiphospho-muramoylpentapeptide beta-N-acetylglucosaminyltransferase [Candidatus Magnetobacterium casense]|uniref:UDP-N-acetylglucosamine--N-acetylmuramyl-(pentapeptide) pyrophosphoryl-undecaprenol N-acetylglucosamine transferase n=1 Tax=Candidatus Magnetobacterium casense TaxID=1455061 RepID=A0ABS6RY94_9BACT|nr:undecaprenyldiphospho-muramoylpentapeptide beta-N-acetylglucosaminyltransferase [Candidatus Magnetobacterium casensis]MBV6340773.1 undecaprenyldiphospho-muramoylpentapeptide beta-N-acetylglucosaminyltransferase [Candidatus Magnetobacterium casensis]